MQVFGLYLGWVIDFGQARPINFVMRCDLNLMANRMHSCCFCAFWSSYGLFERTFAAAVQQLVAVCIYQNRLPSVKYDFNHQFVTSAPLQQTVQKQKCICKYCIYYEYYYICCRCSINDVSSMIELGNEWGTKI